VIPRHQRRIQFRGYEFSGISPLDVDFAGQETDPCNTVIGRLTWILRQSRHSDRAE